jgi:hypothetical protein
MQNHVKMNKNSKDSAAVSSYEALYRAAQATLLALAPPTTLLLPAALVLEGHQQMISIARDAADFYTVHLRSARAVADRFTTQRKEAPQ